MRRRRGRGDLLRLLQTSTRLAPPQPRPGPGNAVPSTTPQPGASAALAARLIVPGLARDAHRCRKLHTTRLSRCYWGSRCCLASGSRSRGSCGRWCPSGWARCPSAGCWCWSSCRGTCVHHLVSSYAGTRRTTGAGSPAPEHGNRGRTWHQNAI